MRRLSRLFYPLLSLLVVSTAQAAGSVSGQLNIRMTITDGCTVENGTAGGVFGSIDFGSVAAITVPQQSQSLGSGGGSFSIVCNNGADYTVEMDGGTNASGGQRYMRNGSELIAYNLYQDAGRSIPWGDGTNNGAPVEATGDGEAQEITVYGEVPVRAAVPAVGDYLDTVQVTVTW